MFDSLAWTRSIEVDQTLSTNEVIKRLERTLETRGYKIISVDVGKISFSNGVDLINGPVKADYDKLLKAEILVTNDGYKTVSKLRYQIKYTRSIIEVIVGVAFGYFLYPMFYFCCLLSVLVWIYIYVLHALEAKEILDAPVLKTTINV